MWTLPSLPLPVLVPHATLLHWGVPEDASCLSNKFPFLFNMNPVLLTESLHQEVTIILTPQMYSSLFNSYQNKRVGICSRYCGLGVGRRANPQTQKRRDERKPKIPVSAPWLIRGAGPGLSTAAGERGLFSFKLRLETRIYVKEKALGRRPRLAGGGITPAVSVLCCCPYAFFKLSLTNTSNKHT